MYVQNIILLNPYPAKNYATYYNGGGGGDIHNMRVKMITKTKLNI